MHHRAGKRPVRPGLQDQRDIRLLHRLVAIDIDDSNLRPTLLPRPDRVGHDVDLRRDRIGPPDHDEIGFRHLARIGPGEAAGAGDIAGPRRVGADRVELAGVLLGVAQPMDAVALHQPHGAGVEIRPHRLSAVLRLGLEELLGDDVERLVPADPLQGALALFAFADKRVEQSVGIVNPLGVAGDLGADDARRVVVVLGAVDAPDRRRVDQLDLERAGRRTVVRAGRKRGAVSERSIHRGKPRR